MLQKPLPHRHADAAGVQPEPFAVMLLQLFHLACQRAAFEAIHCAVFAVNALHALVADGGLELTQRHRRVPQRVRD